MVVMVKFVDIDTVKINGRLVFLFYSTKIKRECKLKPLENINTVIMLFLIHLMEITLYIYCFTSLTGCSKTA